MRQQMARHDYLIASLEALPQNQAKGVIAWALRWKKRNRVRLSALKEGKNGSES